MKRYAIVRVDNECPLNLEDSFYCFEYLRKDKCKKCKDCYGDTKEQLIKKVETAYRLAIADVSEDGIVSYEEVAKFIVDFLGVEE